VDFGPLIPSLMEAFGADKTTLGIVGAGSLWGYMFTPIILAGVIGIGIAFLLTFFWPSCVFLACTMFTATNLVKNR
jgi:hypothetical protein